jgi:3-phenylpropionate/trans-cinnamate dioxygenase ferredoxin reductase subunit
MSLEHIVIAGAGQAGYQVAASLRQDGYTGKLTLVGDEPGVPYQRPPLSKAYLLGKVGRDALRFRTPEFYVQQGIDRVEARITSIDRTERAVLLDDGRRLPYDHLVLALGARNRVPAVPGMELDGVLGIRTLADADALAPRLATARRAVVIGAGFIGLEFAAVAAARGLQVEVLELGSRPMARAITPAMSALFGAAHAGWGVNIRYGTGIGRVLGENGRVSGVETSSGEVLAADLVVYGIGVLPNVELAQGAGLRVQNGVAVDAHLRTSDDAISAIGDLVAFPSAWTNAPVRLESVQNAVDQARAVAARLTGKSDAVYGALPWFWTDQGDLKLQIAGLSDGHDETVVLGSADTRQMSVLCFRQGRLVAVESCNRPADHMAARKLLVRADTLTAAQAGAAGFDLKGHEAATRPAP